MNENRFIGLMKDFGWLQQTHIRPKILYKFVCKVSFCSNLKKVEW